MSEAKKISELTKASVIMSDDVLVGVQEGETKAIPANLLVKKGEAVENATSLNGYTADDFVLRSGTADNFTANNSEKLGGIDAGQYALKTDIYAGQNTNPFWWTPFPFILPFDELWNVYRDDKGRQIYMACEGQDLTIAEFPELYAIVGTKFNRITGDLNIDTPSDCFTLPDLRGRVLIGQSVWMWPNAEYAGRPFVNLPNRAGEYVTNNTFDGICINADIRESLPKDRNSIHANDACLGQMYRASARNVPLHRHLGGIKTTSGSGDARTDAFAYGYTEKDATLGGFSMVMDTTKDGSEERNRLGYTSDSIHVTNGSNFIANYNGDIVPISVIPPALTCKWLMRVVPVK